jgi:hypothetical protein
MTARKGGSFDAGASEGIASKEEGRAGFLDLEVGGRMKDEGEGITPTMEVAL